MLKPSVQDFEHNLSRWEMRVTVRWLARSSVPPFLGVRVRLDLLQSLATAGFTDLLTYWAQHWDVRARAQSCLTLFGPRDHQAPLSVEFPRQEYWNGLPFPTPRDLPDPGIKPVCLASPPLAAGLFTNAPTRKPYNDNWCIHVPLGILICFNTILFPLMFFTPAVDYNISIGKDLDCLNSEIFLIYSTILNYFTYCSNPSLRWRR